MDRYKKNHTGMKNHALCEAVFRELYRKNFLNSMLWLCTPLFKPKWKLTRSLCSNEASLSNNSMEISRAPFLAANRRALQLSCNRKVLALAHFHHKKEKNRQTNKQSNNAPSPSHIHPKDIRLSFLSCIYWFAGTPNPTSTLMNQEIF